MRSDMRKRHGDLIGCGRSLLLWELTDASGKRAGLPEGERWRDGAADGFGADERPELA
jgi:hypothetical protein